MRGFAFVALVAVALLGVTAAAVVGVARGQGGSGPAVLQAAWGAGEQASPSPAAGHNTRDANGINHQTDVSDEQEGPDEDDGDNDQSDVSEHQQGSDEHGTANQSETSERHS